VFCIFLSADPGAATPVIGYNGRLKARSFTEFVDRYIQDPEDLIR